MQTDQSECRETGGEKWLVLSVPPPDLSVDCLLVRNKALKTLLIKL